MVGSEAITPKTGDWHEQGSVAPLPLPAQSTLKKRPIVLLIHGTFANSTECETADASHARTNDGASQNGCEEPAAPGFAADDGKAWWRIGSKVWRSLQNELIPEGLALAGDKETLGIEPGSLGSDGHLKSHLEPFQWPGANTERARHKAGQMLLDRLLHYEEEGRDYHLIGHSHGGSVIWLTLQKAILYRWRRSGEKSELCRLKHLRSWSTIGTAFLHYEGTKLGTWYGKALTISALILCLGFGFWVVQERAQEWQKENNAIGEIFAKLTPPRSLHSEDNPLSEKASPFQQAGQEIQRTTTGLTKAVRLSTQASTTQWLKALWQLLGLMILISSPFLTFYLWSHALRTEARNVYRERRAKNQAMLEFGARWLGIWSSEDEAISGLRATTHVAHSQIVPRLRIPSEPVFESDRIIRFWKPFVRLLLAPVYNGMFGPFADSFVLSRLTRAAQGNNRVGCTLVDVSETPIPMEGFRGEPLPHNLDEDLIAHANAAIGRRSEQVLARARTSLSQFA